MMRRFFTCITLLTGFCLFNCESLMAQEGPFPSSGIGALIPDKGVKAIHLNFPLAPIDLVDPDRPEVKTGMITRINSLNIVFKRNSDPIPYRVSDLDIVELERHGYCLKIFGMRNDCVKILQNSTGTGLWISLKDLDYIRYRAETWQNIILGKPWLCTSSVDVGINLRQKPDAASYRILLVKGTHYGLMFSGKKEGLWAEVRVMRYDKTPCRAPADNPRPIEEWQGWIKIIDDAGYPNIWFAEGKCNN